MDSSSLLDVGGKCSAPQCHNVDFLPIFCRCEQYFCREHIAVECHSCPVDLSALNPRDTSAQPRQHCSAPNCKKFSLDSYSISGRTVDCEFCKKSFCADHRHPKSHSCSKLEDTAAAARKNNAARALLAKNFPSSSTQNKTAPKTRKPKIPTDPLKLAQYRKFELMKLRRRAVPIDSKDKSPVNDRVHIVARWNDAEKYFWVRKGLGAGRVLDLIILHFGVLSNTPHKMFKTSDSDDNPEQWEPFRLDTSFDIQVEEGATVVIHE